MSRFGWAYVNSEMTGAVANGPDKSIQFASGSSQKISGSSNLTFDYTTNTLYLTGTLRADTLIVSASQILKSGSTIFGDDVADTHQFTGSIYNTTLVSGTIARFTTITGSNISASTSIQTAGTITAGSNITSTGGTISASVGFQTAGTLTAGSGIIVTGSSFVQALSSSAQIQATSFRGDGLNITGVMASNTIAAGNDWNVQFFNANTGYITGSNSLIISASSTPGLFLTQFSSSGIVKSSVVRSTNRTLNDGDYYLFFSSSSPLTATLGTAVTGREVILSNYGTAELLITGSTGVVGFITTAGSNVQSVIIGGAGARTLKFVYLSNNGRWMAV